MARPRPSSVVFVVAVALLGVFRSLIGLLMLVSPRRLVGSLTGDAAAAARTGWVSQMVGAREVAIGMGSLKAVREGDRVGLWCAAATVADLGDVLAVSAAVRDRRVRRWPGLLFVAFAAAGVVADVTVWRHLRGRS
jgi:hypothetical protein